MKSLFLSLFFCVFFTTIFAQPGSAGSATEKTGSAIPFDTTAMAKIYVIRSTGYVGSAVNLRVVVNNMMKCKVRNNRYAVVYVEPGTHSFNASSWDKGTREKTALKMPVEAGKTYYMSMRINQKFFGAEIFLEEVTHNTAAPLLEKYKQDECD